MEAISALKEEGKHHYTRPFFLLCARLFFFSPLFDGIKENGKATTTLLSLSSFGKKAANQQKEEDEDEEEEKMKEDRT